MKLFWVLITYVVWLPMNMMLFSIISNINNTPIVNEAGKVVGRLGDYRS